jgi:acyl-CoA synthetase (AMP-forming)/AMP-acid ligase II
MLPDDVVFVERVPLTAIGKIVYCRIYSDTAKDRDVLGGLEPRQYPKLDLNL